MDRPAARPSTKHSVPAVAPSASDLTGTGANGRAESLIRGGSLSA